ncbi:tripartite tricarboxylate transporter TctB family protein [Evansella clarkii]|uniref:tripartite tricarboxylate transporter TctB family protein n=1 Tax=Evansella clarkii TaxID=79879 RepID=UPI000B438C0B|nr:tripartite tricarboxylate transporter TctB family protein [Evansella clarkii]
MGEIVIGILIILLCLLLYFNSDGFPQINETHLDPGSYPRLVASILFILCLLLLIQKVRNMISGRDERIRGNFRDNLNYIWTEYRLVIITFAVLVLYIIFITILGFIISSILFIVATALIIGPKKKKDIVIAGTVSVMVTLGLYFFFETALNVRFPNGLLF